MISQSTMNGTEAPEDCNKLESLLQNHTSTTNRWWAKNIVRDLSPLRYILEQQLTHRPRDHQTLPPGPITVVLMDVFDYSHSWYKLTDYSQCGPFKYFETFVIALRVRVFGKNFLSHECGRQFAVDNSSISINLLDTGRLSHNRPRFLYRMIQNTRGNHFAYS